MGRCWRWQRNVEAPGGGEARGQSSFDRARARDRDFRLEISGKFRKGGPPQWCCGAGTWSRCSFASQVRARTSRKRVHAILPSTEDRRVIRFGAAGGLNGRPGKGVDSDISAALYVRWADALEQ